MKRTIPDQAADARLERLLDAELHAVVDAPAVDLRDKVLRAIDEVQRAEFGVQSQPDVQSRLGRILQPRWALAVAAAAVLVFAIVTIRHGTGPQEPEQLAANHAPLASSPLGLATHVEPAIGTQERPAPAARRRAAPAADWDREPVVADASASKEPYLPGAPAGELGDPLRPMPSPPPISFAPITHAPLVSEFARPVTDFPADNPAPAQQSGEAGQSGGTRR